VKSEGMNMNTDEFEIILSGLYRIPAGGTVVPAPNFALPAKVNEFRAGNAYSCNLTKLVKETKVTEATFQCKYTGTGNQLGLLQPSKAAVKLENGQEYATSISKSKVYLMTPGEEEKIKVEFNIPGKIADMQFANMEIMWKESFRESMGAPVPEKTAKVLFDPGLTQGKNK
jgi:hypothetical protein